MNLSVFRRYTAPAVLLAAVWLVVTHNTPYWRLLIEQTGHSPWFLASLGVFTVAVVNLVLSLLTFGRTTRYVLALLLCVSAAAAWFMSHMGVMLDKGMIENVFETDRVEALELLNPGVVLNLLLLGALPAAVLWFLVPRRQSLRTVVREKAFAVGLSLFAVVVAVAPFYKDYASLFRNHREVRYLLTPVNAVGSLYGYLSDLAETPSELVRVGADARKGPAWQGKERPVLSVIVLGETARAESFSLYGYERPTNPELGRRDLIRFDEVSTCGTATAVSLPCMFSDLGREDFDRAAVRSRESLLDVLQHAGMRAVWLDNNSGCKGVCRNAETWSPEGLDIPQMCTDGECLDAILLDRLDRELAAVTTDTVVVIHMNGSHGPSYYRRYPETFRHFTPDCRSDELSDCTRDEILNSYDNSIRYTDWFVAEVLDRLDRAARQLDTSLLYVSDHGESLGEFGLYLHGTPYFMAPKEQTRVPMLLWLSSSFAGDFGIDPACLRRHHADPVSHDNLFHSVLGMLDIHTDARHEDLDLFAGCTAHPGAGEHHAAVAPGGKAAVEHGRSGGAHAHGP